MSRANLLRVGDSRSPADVFKIETNDSPSQLVAALAASHTNDVRASVAQHFSSRAKYDKEVAETAHVLNFLRSVEPTQVLSLACGGCVGAETFSDYFPHPLSRLHGIDLAQNQTAAFYMQHGLLRFQQADLLEEPSPAVLSTLRSCHIWLAIHACHHLAHRVLHLFKQHAPSSAQLLLLPCCLLKRTELIAKVGPAKWKQTKTHFQFAQKQHDDLKKSKDEPASAVFAYASSSSSTSFSTSSSSSSSSAAAAAAVVFATELYSLNPLSAVHADWRTSTSMLLRNELLASEFATGFCGYVHLRDIPSQYNTGLHFRKQHQQESSQVLRNH